MREHGFASPDPEPAPEAPLLLMPFGEAAAPYLSDAWLVDDVLPMTGLGVMYGAPGAKKTFTAIDLCLHIATGRRWRDRSVERRGVIYLSLEGGGPFANRLHAWASHHGVDPGEPAFWRCAQPLDLRSTEADTERVIVSAKAVAAGSHIPIGLVVIDTLNRAMPGGNENAVEDMGRVIGHAQAIADALNCFVLIVHHSGKDVTKGSRGHSSLLGAIDTELQVADGALTITKQRDGEAGQSFGIGLERVEIGTTDRGKLITSAVIVPAEIDREDALSPSQRDTLAAVREYLIDYGTPNPAGAGWPEKGARKVAERAALVAFLAGKQSAPTDSERRKQSSRKLDRLRGAGIIQQNEGFIWIC